MKFKRVMITAVMAIAMVVTLAPAMAPKAHALTAEELQQQILQLQAQLNQLEGEGTVATGMPSACIGITFTRDLSRNSVGTDVKCLQAVLNQLNVQVSNTGPGSPGSETTFFGDATLSAVQRYQTLNSISPAAGYVGPITRASLNANLSTFAAVTTNLPAGCTSTSGYSSTTGVKCDSNVTTTTLPAGCTSTAGYSPTTGVKCDSTTTSTLPAGCTSTSGFSSTTGDKCDGTDDTDDTTPGTAFSVNLASSNPASSTLVAGQAAADLLHFTVNGTGTVTNIKLMRTGVSSSSTLSNVYLFDGFTRLTDAATVNNAGEVNFNLPSGLFTVSGSRTISVRADVAANTAGQTVGLNFVSGTMSSTALTGSANGNLFNIAEADLGTVAFATPTPNGGTINPGPAITIWQSTATISTRDSYLDRIALRQTGSAPAGALANFKLSVNGVVVATADGLDANGYVTFVPSTPTLLVTGSRIFKVEADVVSGASRTILMSLRSAADAWLRDSQLGVNITATGIPAVPANAITISGTLGGSLTLEKDVTSPSQNITVNASDVVLARFKATAFGEAIKLETLSAGLAAYSEEGAGDANAAATLRNGRIMIDGAQYGSTATIDADTSYTLNYIINPGTPVMIEVRADVFDNDGTGAISEADTLQIELVTGSSNAVRMDSLGTFNAPAADVPANTLTVATTAMTLAENTTYADRTVVVPQTGYKIGSWNLSGSSSEDILLSTLSFDVNEITNDSFNQDDITNMYAVIKSGGTTVVQTSPLATVSAADNNYSISYTLAQNSSVAIELYGSLGSTIDADDAFNTDLTVTGTSAISGTAVTADNADTAGQTITGVTSGTITATVDSGLNPVAFITEDNKTVTTAAFRFATVNDGYNVTDATLTLGADAVTNTSSVQLWDGSTMIAELPGATTMNFSGLSWNVPANTNKVLTVKAVLGTISSTSGTSGAVLTTTLTAFTATSIATGTSDASGNDAGPSIENDPAGNAHYAYAAIPVISSVALPTSTLSNSNEVVISKFTVTPTGGNISWDRLFFEITKDTDTEITNANVYDVTGGGNTLVVGTDTQVDGGDGDATGTIEYDATTEQELSSARTYELRVDIDGSVVDTSFVTTKMAGDAVFAAPTDAAAVEAADADATIIWSDLSAASHDTTTDDWNGEFGVKNLPISHSISR